MKLSKFQRYPIWLAQYVPDSTKGQETPKNLPEAWTSWAIWQFTKSGGFTQGLKAAVDVSVFKGSLEKFLQTFGVTLPPPATGSNDNPNPRCADGRKPHTWRRHHTRRQQHAERTRVRFERHGHASGRAGKRYKCSSVRQRQRSKRQPNREQRTGRRNA